MMWHDRQSYCQQGSSHVGLGAWCKAMTGPIRVSHLHLYVALLVPAHAHGLWGVSSVQNDV